MKKKLIALVCALALAVGLVGCSPVSYTHLDVYKRQVTCNLQSSLSGTLAVTGLQHIQVAVLNGELHILHIAEVVLQTGRDLNELIVHLRHLILQVADGRRSAHLSLIHIWMRPSGSMVAAVPRPFSAMNMGFW